MIDLQRAVDDPEWQKFRMSLKGLPTTRKISRLEEYFRGMHHAQSDWTETEQQLVAVRVDNYIKALCRGGQLWPGESLQSCIDQGWKPAIKK